MFRRRNFLSYAFPIMYVTIWCFFWSTYFSSISTTNFFSAHIFVATNYFFQFYSSPRRPPPRPQISNGASLRRRSFVKRCDGNLIHYTVGLIRHAGDSVGDNNAVRGGPSFNQIKKLSYVLLSKWEMSRWRGMSGNASRQSRKQDNLWSWGRDYGSHLTPYRMCCVLLLQIIGASLVCGFVQLSSQVLRALLLSRQDTSIQCWFDVGPASATPAQHQTSNGSRIYPDGNPSAIHL